MAAPKRRVLRQWTEFERHTLGSELADSDPMVYEVILRVMRKQDEIIGVINRIPEVMYRTVNKAVLKGGQ